MVPGTVAGVLELAIHAMHVPAPAMQALRRVLGRRVLSGERFRAEVYNRYGLEIGGPSSIFQDAGALPLYRYVACLDNCVFGLETVWEGKRAEGWTFLYHPRKPRGFHFISEATDLRRISPATYDFILSAHCLEHIANPVKALREWIRIVKPGGSIIALLPHYQKTFDHRRQPTPLDHMLGDYARGASERDLSHLPEVLALHDLSRDTGISTASDFYQRSLRNFENRCLHHHVFDENNSRKLFEAVGLTVEVQEFAKPHHIVLLSRCP